MPLESDSRPWPKDVGHPNVGRCRAALDRGKPRVVGLSLSPRSDDAALEDRRRPDPPRAMTTNFDDYRADYEARIERSISFAGRDHAFFVAGKARRLLELISRHVGPPSRQRVLDIGCGPGIAHHYLREITGLEGVDVSESMIELARQANPNVRYEVGDALALPFEAKSFDVVVAITVLHHVEPPSWGACFQEMRRVLRPSGLAVIFEHNPLNPLTRVAVNRCDFDEDAVLLSRRETKRLMLTARFDIVDDGYMFVTPWDNAVACRLDRIARHLPLGAQYYMAGRA
jgi:SAM-dependent methyltransferase